VYVLVIETMWVHGVGGIIFCCSREAKRAVFVRYLAEGVVRCLAFSNSV